MPGPLESHSLADSFKKKQTNLSLKGGRILYSTGYIGGYPGFKSHNKDLQNIQTYLSETKLFVYDYDYDTPCRSGIGLY
jgi:hypothetical protein